MREGLRVGALASAPRAWLAVLRIGMVRIKPVKWSRLPVKRKAMSPMSINRLSRARLKGVAPELTRAKQG